ncbi:hypothetical protein AVEN_34632-1 [Araneus ventricosus]|uniref:Uncharacterized protein n=1 Tax=Araneus ventricosus TaxID=182803 RepID=A0A4Y2AZD5_ARAVE|nr:hypothetical protein AVEN_34632-1 [Araneus ventricosus]
MYLLFVALALLFISILWKIARLSIWRLNCSQLMPGSHPSVFNPLGNVALIVAKYIVNPDSDTLHFNFFQLLRENYQKFRKETMFCLWVAYEPFVMILKADAAKPHCEGLIKQPFVSLGYDLSSEMGLTTIIVPSGWREPAYLYGSLSSVCSRCPPPDGV